MTQIVCDPGLHEPGEEDDCQRFAYFCQTHDRTYWHESCGEGPHLIALHCLDHGPENMWPQALMLMFPEGFDPPLSDAQLAWVRAENDADQVIPFGTCMMTRMNTETCDPAELAALREIFASRPEAAPPVGWEAVRSFEAEHGIVLPEPYRTCVAEICDGLRAGPPFYGLLPFAQTPSDWGSDRPERLLAEPFPLTTTWVWENDEEELSEEEIEARTDAVFDHGSLLLGTDGCGMYWHLVVTGPQRGHVWLIDEYGAMPFGTSSNASPMPGTPGFTGWVTHWAQGRSWFADAPEATP